MNQKTKNITLVALLSALQIVIMMYLPLISLFSLVVFTLALTKKQAIGLAVVSSLLACLISFKLVSLTNIILLPIICLIIKTYQEKRIIACSKGHTKKNAIELGLLSFVFIFLSNIISEFFAMVIFSYDFSYIIVSLPIALIGAIINAIIIGLFALAISIRLCKIMLKVN